MKFSLVSVLAVIFLASCGGGGSGSGGDKGESIEHAVDASALLGSWKACFNDGSTSEAEEFTFTDTSPASSDELDFSLQYDTFDSLDCSGTATSSETYSGLATLDGRKTIGSETAERITLNVTAPASETVKQVFVVSATSFKVGEDPTTDRDADGYPNALNTSGEFVKQ